MIRVVNKSYTLVALLVVCLQYASVMSPSQSEPSMKGMIYKEGQGWVAPLAWFMPKFSRSTVSPLVNQQESEKQLVENGKRTTSSSSSSSVLPNSFVVDEQFDNDLTRAKVSAHYLVSNKHTLEKLLRATEVTRIDAICRLVQEIPHSDPLVRGQKKRKNPYVSDDNVQPPAKRKKSDDNQPSLSMDSSDDGSMADENAAITLVCMQNLSTHATNNQSPTIDSSSLDNDYFRYGLTQEVAEKHIQTIASNISETVRENKEKYKAVIESFLWCYAKKKTLAKNKEQYKDWSSLVATARSCFGKEKMHNLRDIFKVSLIEFFEKVPGSKKLCNIPENRKGKYLYSPAYQSLGKCIKTMQKSGLNLTKKENRLQAQSGKRFQEYILAVNVAESSSSSSFLEQFPIGKNQERKKK